MITLLTAAALAAAPAPNVQPAEAPKAEAACDMPCCKGKKMPCCDKMAADKKAAAPADGHGGHEHDH